MPAEEKTRREFLKIVGVGASSLALSGGAGLLSCQKGNEKPPNIVIIFIDDQGYADVGAFGAKGFSTPNIDRMAAEGIKFTDFCVSEAVCSASRASLLTGCYSERVGIRGALGPNSRIGLNPEEETIAEILKKRGYATGIFGKWHLGDNKKFLPLQQGFDEYLGLPYSNDMWPVWYDGKPATKGRKSKYPPLPLIDGNEKVAEIKTLDDQATLTTRYTERAVQFIEKNKDRPFFLYVPHSMVHVPLGVSKKFRGKSEQGMYGDVCMEVDWSVGEILAVLKKNGLAENTLVIYTSDNGPWLNFGNHAGSAYPLREGKGTMWEGGVREPCIMRWPGHIPANTVCDKMAATIDILPTVAAITGAPLPEKKIDGMNILPLMEGKIGANPRNEYLYYYGGELRAVRRGKWKLFFPHKSRSYVGVEPGHDGFPGPYATLQVGLELYNLENDIGEKNNIAAQHPGVVARLKKSAQKARLDLGDRLTGVQGKGVREPGRIGPVAKKRKIHHLAVGKEIALQYFYSPKYPAGGETALIDGIRGTSDFRDGAWQGYEKNDLVAVIDLGKQTTVSKISCGFLQNQNSWIFFPSAVEFAISADGMRFKTLKRIQQKKIKPDYSVLIKDYSAEFKPLQTFLIRITAKNIGVCPEWHEGAGGKAWVFADEIIVK
ncbi:MAG TPA: arylsulfatase [Bacteroidetes bacterium]|nr:arylsulfatase [Bacteroidota bacterium]